MLCCAEETLTGGLSPSTGESHHQPASLAAVTAESPTLAGARRPAAAPRPWSTAGPAAPRAGCPAPQRPARPAPPPACGRKKGRGQRWRERSRGAPLRRALGGAHLRRSICRPRCSPKVRHGVRRRLERLPRAHRSKRRHQSRHRAAGRGDPLQQRHPVAGPQHARAVRHLRRSGQAWLRGQLAHQVLCTRAGRRGCGGG